MDKDILIYVEDPGAANYVAELPAALAENGWRTSLLAERHAYPYLLQRGIQPDMVDPSITASEILDQLKPRLVAVGTSENPDTFGFKLVQTAHVLGIKTLGLVDAFGNADYRFRGQTDNSLAYAPEWLAVPDLWTKEAYISLGYPPDHVTVCGHPHYDYVLDTRARLEREDTQRLRRKMFPANQKDAPVVVFVSEISTGLNPGKYNRTPDYTLQGRGKLTSRTEIVLEEFLDALAVLESRPYLVLRMHPKNTREELASFLRGFDYVSEKEDPLDIVYASDLVVGMTTMLLMEAAIMGKQTLSIVPRSDEKRSLPTIMAGITPCVTTRVELRAVLPVLLERCSRKEADNKKKVFIQHGSLQKTVAFIEDLLIKNSSSIMNKKDGRVSTN
jgi:hypothetical protein